MSAGGREKADPATEVRRCGALAAAGMQEGDRAPGRGRLRAYHKLRQGP
jgi:hypothetical protein